MPQQRYPYESPRTIRPAAETTLPPGLQINPIQEASAPVNRRASLLISTLVSISLFFEGVYLIELSQRDHSQPWDDRHQVVRLLLQDEFQLSEAQGSGGGITAADSHKQTDQVMSPAISAVHPIGLHSESSQEPQDFLVPLETPKSYPELQPEVQVPILSASSVGHGIGNGIGNGLGSGTGNGMRNGTGRGRGTTWIHSASGGEGIQVADSVVGVQHFISPEYPSAAHFAGISGDVVIEVTIDEEGKPIKWKVIDGHASLAEATLKVFPLYRFIPIRYNGQRVRATFEARIRFTIY